MRIKSKTREFIYLDNKDKCLKENMSDYNYNFEEFKLDEETLEQQVYRPKNTINKDFFTLKR